MQVFATYPNEDYDRRNEDVDPMAASAEYELEKRVERLDLFPVELEKGEPSVSANVRYTARAPRAVPNVVASSCSQAFYRQSP